MQLLETTKARNSDYGPNAKNPMAAYLDPDKFWLTTLNSRIFLLSVIFGIYNFPTCSESLQEPYLFLFFLILGNNHFFFPLIWQVG